MKVAKKKFTLFAKSKFTQGGGGGGGGVFIIILLPLTFMDIRIRDSTMHVCIPFQIDASFFLFYWAILIKPWLEKENK